ncbi:MAG: hypothetical protein P8X58_13995 [Syntrophobacterales bacterium]
MRGLTRGIVTIILCLLLAWSMAWAAEGNQPVPNLLGTWTGQGKVIYLTEEIQKIKKVQITEQSGAYFRGFDAWKFIVEEVEPGKKSGKVKKIYGQSEGKDPILGVVGFDGKIYIAEHGSVGYLFGRLVGPDSMEIIELESGPEALAERILLQRKR